MSQVIGYILDTSTGFKEVHSNGMAQRVNISRAESCCLSIVGKQMLNHAFLHGALPSSEEIWGDIPAHSQVRTQKFCGVSPQGLLSADTIFKTPYPDTVIFYINVFYREHGRFVYSQKLF
jgi:hypothetical protein